MTNPVRPMIIITKPEISAAAKSGKPVLVTKFSVIHEGDRANLRRSQGRDPYICSELSAGN